MKLIKNYKISLVNFQPLKNKLRLFSKLSLKFKIIQKLKMCQLIFPKVKFQKTKKNRKKRGHKWQKWVRPPLNKKEVVLGIKKKDKFKTKNE